MREILSKLVKSYWSLLSLVLWLLRGLLSTSGSHRCIAIICGRSSSRGIVVYLPLLLLKVLSLILLLLVSIKQVDVSLHYSSEVVKGVVSADGCNFKLACLLLLLNVELDDATLLIEEAQVLLVGTAHVLDKFVVKWNKDTFEHNFPDSIFHAPLCFTVDSELTLISICC